MISIHQRNHSSNNMSEENWSGTHIHTHTHLVTPPKTHSNGVSSEIQQLLGNKYSFEEIFPLCLSYFFFFKKLLISLWKMKSNEVSLKNESFCTLHMQELNQDMWKSVYVLWYNALGKRISFFSDFWWRTPWKSVPARTSSSKWHFIS